MDTNSLREVARRRPFQPFRMRMTDGRAFHAPHPEYVAVSKRVVVVMDPVTDAAIHLEPLLIASLHFENAPSAPSSKNNGA